MVKLQESKNRFFVWITLFILIFLVLLMPFIASKELRVKQAGIIPMKSIAEIDILKPNGDLEVKIALVFLVDENYQRYPNFDVNIFFDGIEPMPHKFPLEPELIICEGYHSTNLDTKGCDKEINYKPISKRLGELDKGYAYTWAIEHDALSINEFYTIWVNYIVPEFTYSLKSWGHYQIFIENACKHQMCPTENYNTRTIFLPTKTSVVESIDPRPENMAYTLDDSRLVFQFHGQEKIFIKFVDTAETEFLMPLFWMFVGAFSGAMLGLIVTAALNHIKRICQKKTESNEVVLPKGIGPKTLEKIDNANLKLTRK